MRPWIEPSRWPARGLVGVVLSIVTVLLPGTVQGQEHDHGGGADGLIPPGDWTQEQIDHMLDLIERTEAALPQFADVDDATSLGFVDFGAVAPGGYFHFGNPTWVEDDDFLNPERPEVLVYQGTWDQAGELTDLVLVAAMYQLNSNYTMANIPADIAWLPGWHIHPELCFDEDGRFVSIDGPECRSGGRPSDGLPMMHVWIEDNVCGHRFAGIGVGGIECDVHSHEPQPGGGTTTTTTQPPAGTAPPPPPAPAISAQPNFTG